MVVVEKNIAEEDIKTRTDVVVKREKSVTTREKALEARIKEHLKERAIFKDRKAMFERDIKRQQK